MNAAVERLLTTARAEIGYHEKASNANLDSKTANSGSANYTKYARDLDALGDVYNGRKNGYDWCDVFVDWCFIRTFGKELGMKLLCQAYRGLGAGCKYSMQYYQAKGQFHKTGPQPGDQLFFGDSSSVWHTGIVEKVESGKVYTIEGNTGPGSVQVAHSTYSLSYQYIKGYGRPDWSLAKEELEPPEEDEDMDLDGFKKLWYELRAELQDNDSSSYSDAAKEWAISNGIIQGNSKTNPNYMWEDMMTREQMVTVLYRFAQLIGKA